MKNNRYKFLLTILLQLIFNSLLFAQKADTSNTPGIITINGKPTIYLPQQNAAQAFQLSRSINNGKFTNIPWPVKAGSVQEFRLIAGDSATDSIKANNKLKSEDELWQFLTTHTDIETYGLLSLSPAFLKAMGLAYTDGSLAEMPTGTKVVYEVLDVNDPGSKIIYNYVVNGTTNLGKPQFVSSRVDDTVGYIKWGYKYVPSSSMAAYAVVYKSNGNSGFTAGTEHIVPSLIKDSVYFTAHVNTSTLNIFKYYILPVTVFGVPGSATSDTATLVPVDFNRLPVVENITAKDTLAAIGLKWKMLPVNAAVTGIEIQRSKVVGAGYRSLSTVSASATGYLDKTAAPGATYYYRVRSVGAPGHQDDGAFNGYVLATANINQTPDAPYKVTAITQPDGVHIAWMRVKKAIGYYIFRADVNDDTKMEAISKLLKDTAHTVFVDTAKYLSSRTNYFYKIRAVNLSGNQSKFSVAASARLPVGVDKIGIPNGISISLNGQKIHLEWDDIKAKDVFIAGYVLYKRTQDSQGVTVSGATVAKQTFKKLLNLSKPFYNDASPTPGENVDYAVAAVDIYGKEGALSQVVSTVNYNLYSVKPPSAVYLRRTAEGVEIRWTATDATIKGAYNIYRRSIDEKLMKKIGYVAAGQYVFTDKSTAVKTLYVYEIKTEVNHSESNSSVAKSIRVD